MGAKEMGAKEMGVKEMGVKELIATGSMGHYVMLRSQVNNIHWLWGE